MIERNDVLYLVDRIVGMWPVIKNNDEHKKAIAELVWEKRSGITNDDLNNGFRTLIANSRTARADGGPAWPPSPSEVLGCVLSSASKRTSDVPRPADDSSPGIRRVAGALCVRAGCNGPIDFIRSENVLWCGKCNSVQQRGESFVLTPHEVHSIHFIDEVRVTVEEVAEHKKKAMLSFQKMKALTSSNRTGNDF